MPWEQIASWVAIACLVAAVVFGRRASKNKQNRLRAEGGRAALAAHLQQSVVTNVDARSVLAGDVGSSQALGHAGHAAAHYGPADDLALDRAVNLILARLLGGSDGSIGLAPGDSATALGLPGASGGAVRREGAPVDHVRVDTGTLHAVAAGWYSEQDSPVVELGNEPTNEDMARWPWRYEAS